MALASKESAVENREEVDAVEWQEKAKLLSPLSHLQAINYGTSKLLADLSVEPTPSNAQLFQICKTFDESVNIWVL